MTAEELSDLIQDERRVIEDQETRIARLEAERDAWRETSKTWQGAANEYKAERDRLREALTRLEFAGSYVEYADGDCSEECPACNSGGRFHESECWLSDLLYSNNRDPETGENTPGKHGGPSDR